MENNKLLNISKKTFISIVILLFVLIVLSIILTYIIPRGAFSVVDGVTNYSDYQLLPDKGGINIFKGIFAPILLLGSSDGLAMIMLSIFLLVISGVFQLLNDTAGLNAIVLYFVRKFQNKKILFFFVMVLLFMAFGSFLGLFEEVLVLLPVIIILTISLGYDSFTGFLISIVACGMGFASSISNPFTVLFASKIIGVNPLIKVWFRLIIFVLMYLFTMGVVLLYVRKIKKNPEASFTYKHDMLTKQNLHLEQNIQNERKLRITTALFFLVVLTTLIVFSSLEALRDYTIPALIGIFLFGGFIVGFICSKDFKLTAKSFFKGVLSGLPTILLVLMAASIKYILVEGMIIDTVTNHINTLILGKNIYVIALMIYLIVLVLEFFISSSTAKAIFVMGILSVIAVPLTKETLVLLYTLGDGYTNLLFPTSPVLLISLSMIGFDYFKWIRKSWWVFIIHFIVVIGLIFLAVLIKY